MRDKIQAVVNELQPMFRADGNELQLVGVNEGIVRIRITGACGDCTGALMSLRQAVERMIREQVPEVREVIAV